VYGKATHTNPYLNARSHPHSSYEISVLSTLAHRDTAICDRTVSSALDTLQSIFRNNGFSPKEPEWFLYPPQPIRQPRDMAITYLPFVQNTFKSIGRALSKHTSRPLAHHAKNFWNTTSRRRRPGSQISRPASAGKCIPDKPVVPRRQELHQPEKSVVAEHNNDVGHRVLHSNTRILAKISRRMDRLIREAVEM
jgi:hypothetical protein